MYEVFNLATQCTELRGVTEEEREKFFNSLKLASEEVETWPKWKRELFTQKPTSGDSNQTPPRVQVLELAHECVTKTRQETHGDASEQLDNAARYWSHYLGIKVSAKDVCCLMALLKISRSQHGSHNLEDFADLSGYASLAYEVGLH